MRGALRPWSLTSASCALTLAFATGRAEAIDWSGAVGAGVDLRYTPDLNGNGWVLLDLHGRHAVAGGDLHLTYNTDTVQVGIEGIPIGQHVELSLALRGEALIAGLLPFYYQGGVEQSQRGFWASYLMGYVSFKWMVGGPHTIELLGVGRQWYFGAHSGGDPSLVIPPDTAVFEPRLRYTLWAITSPDEEWEAHRVFPRIEGVALGIELGIDLRSDDRAWGMVGGTDDGRNHPASVIYTARQWLRGGGHIHPNVRLQLAEWSAWGSGEDDITRVRVGGMNPYVVVVPGLPWAALLCDKLVSAEGSIFWAPGGGRHEVGLSVGGGAFNDVYRTGQTDTFGVAAGVGAMGDLRFGRWQVYLRGGYALPTAWLRDSPSLSGLIGVGTRL